MIDQFLVYILKEKGLHNETRSVGCYVPFEESLLEQAALLVSEWCQSVCMPSHCSAYLLLQRYAKCDQEKCPIAKLSSIKQYACKGKIKFQVVYKTRKVHGQGSRLNMNPSFNLNKKIQV